MQSVLFAINYRPVSLTFVASKIMECKIATQIYVHLLENNLLSSAQHGFVKGRSTCTNLFDAVNDWTLTVQNKKKRSPLHILILVGRSSLSHVTNCYYLFIYLLRRNHTHKVHKNYSELYGTQIGNNMYKLTA